MSTGPDPAGYTKPITADEAYVFGCAIAAGHAAHVRYMLEHRVLVKKLPTGDIFIWEYMLTIIGWLRFAAKSRLV